jgi:HTH-type transcriptional regulator/antitoxin HipB
MMWSIGNIASGGSMGKKKSPLFAASSQLNFLASPAEVGKAVRTARDQRGMTQAGLAEKANVHRSFVIDLENGKESLHLGKVLTCLMCAGLVGVIVPVEAVESAQS